MARHLNDAYTFLAKRDMKVKPSLGLQAFIHHHYCSDSQRGVHNSKGGLFFAFHRALLVFHERLLQWVLEKQLNVDPNTAKNFRLPYWDPRTDHGVYADSNLKGLYRARGPRNTDRPKLTAADCDQTDLVVFGDRVLTWHGNVHNWMCGDFHDAKVSGFDPLFYAFHAFVDLVWESSKVKAQISVTPDPWWGVFYDIQSDADPYTGRAEEGWCQANMNDFKDAKRWGYFYESKVQCDPNISGLEFTNVPLPKSDAQDFRLIASRRRSLRASPSRNDQRQIAEIHPFGHAEGYYPFVRAAMSFEDAKDLAKAEAWDFEVRATNGGKPVSARITAMPTPVE